MSATFIILVILSYFIGAIPFSYIASAGIGGVDIRKKGSGNVGATNVLRTLGLKVALLSFAGDVLKGVAAAWLGLHFGGESLAAVCAAVAVVGHCWPVFLNFSGGKGVATAAGIIVFLMPKIVAILVAVFIIIVVFSRYVSLGSITVAALFPILAIILGEPLPYIILAFFMGAIVIYGHRENIVRLKNGNESKLGKKAS